MIRILFPILLISLFWAPAALAQDGDANPEAFIEGLGNRAIELLADPDATEASLSAAFRDMFGESFDTNTIGRFVLGRHWNGASEEQRQEYLALFKDFVVGTYADRFSEYSGQQFLVHGSRPAGSNDILVSTRIVDPGGRPPISVDWRTRARNGRVQIIDVVVANVSMVITYRDEFSAVIRRQGGTLDGLIQALRQRVAEMQAG